MSWTRSVTLSLALLALTACKRGSDAPAPRVEVSAAAGDLTEPPMGTLFPAGVLLQGDRASLQHYLRYVDTVVGATVHVTYAPGTVVLDRDAAINSLRSASWDGVTWRFDAAEPAMQRVKPGSVLLVWGLAIRRVKQVDRVGDEIVLRTEEAQLNDAVTDADIKWEAPAHLLQGAMALRVPKPQDSVRFRSASFVPPPAAPSLFRFASLTTPADTDADEPDDSAAEPPAQYQRSFVVQVGTYAVAMAYGAPSEDQLNFYAQFAHGEDAEEPVGLPNELSGFKGVGTKVHKWAKKRDEEREKEAKEGKKKAIQARDSGRTMSGPGPGLRNAIAPTSEEQHKQKAEEEEEAAYQKKYGKQSRNSTEGMPKLPKLPEVPKNFGEGMGAFWEGLQGLTAIKVTAVGKVTGLSSRGDISIKGGRLEHAMLSNPEFHLVGDIYWAARIDVAVFASHTHVEVPVTFRVPLIIGGLPAFFELAVNAQIQPALTGKKSISTGHRHIDFTKSAQFTVTSDDVTGEQGDPAADADMGSEERSEGLGVSGLMVALQVPRVGLGFGIIGSNVMAYFDVVVASGTTFTGSTGIIKCAKMKLVANLNVGVSASFLGFPLGDKRKAGPSKEWNWTNPPGRKCGGD